MSADFLGQDVIDRMVQIWLSTDFEGGRHQRRVEKIAKYEAEHP
jgi:ribose 5-phosphate isomerase B